LAYHRQHSGPVMDDLKAWLRDQLDQRLVEPNSPFGEATQYMLKRWDVSLRQLCVTPASMAA